MKPATGRLKKKEALYLYARYIDREDDDYHMWGCSMACFVLVSQRTLSVMYSI